MPRPAASTRRSRSTARPSHALLRRLRHRHPRAGAVRPGRPRPGRARHRHPGQPRAHRRRLRRPAATRPGPRRELLGLTAPRAGHRDSAGLPEPLLRRARHVVSEVAAGRRVRRRAASRTTGACSARCSTPRTPPCATTTRSPARSSTSPSRPPAGRGPGRADDRRRLRRLGHRPGAPRARRRGAAAVATAFSRAAGASPTSRRRRPAPAAGRPGVGREPPSEAQVAATPMRPCGRRRRTARGRGARSRRTRGRSRRRGRRTLGAGPRATPRSPPRPGTRRGPGRCPRRRRSAPWRWPGRELDHGGHLVGLGDVVPVQVDLVGRDLRDDVADAVELGVAEQRVGVHLQRALADDGAVALVVEVAVDRARVDEPAHGRHVGLLHRQHDVVVERLAVALDQHVVRREAGAADAEAGLPDDVTHVVEQAAVEALGLRDRVQVGLEGLLDLARAPRWAEPARSRPR